MKKSVEDIIEKAEIYRVEKEDLFVFYIPKYVSPQDREQTIITIAEAMQKLGTLAIVTSSILKIETLPKEEAKRILSGIIGEEERDGNSKV